MSIQSESIAERTTLIRTYYPLTNNWLSDIKDILLRFLRHYFIQMEEGQFKYTANEDPFSGGTSEKVTEIIITDAGTIDTDTIEKRPVIIVSRTPFNYSNLGMDNLVSESFTTSKRTHTDLISGAFTINCISRIGLEAETIAMYVAKGLKFYRRDLQKFGFFQIGQRVTIGSESPANSLVGGDSDEDFINVPVSFPVFYQETWTIAPQDNDKTTLSAVNTVINSIAKTLSDSLLYPDALDEDGNVNSSSDGVIIENWTLTTS